eukprot:3528514-Pleurochrysis_carterae.AAC.1
MSNGSTSTMKKVSDQEKQTRIKIKADATTAKRPERNHMSCQLMLLEGASARRSSQAGYPRGSPAKWRPSTVAALRDARDPRHARVRSRSAAAALGPPRR